MLASCNSSNKDFTQLSLNIGTRSIDTLGLMEELKGLFALSTKYAISGNSYDIDFQAVDQQTLDLKVRPKLNQEQRDALETIFDKLIAHPSTWSVGNLKLKYLQWQVMNEQERALTEQSYPFEIDYASANWRASKDRYTAPGLFTSGAARTFLSYDLKQKIPSMMYALALKGGNYQEGNDVANFISSLFQAVGPINFPFKITSVDTSITPLWDSIQMNYRVNLDSTKLLLRWDYVEFPYREYNQVLDRDTLLVSNIDKLKQTPSYVFHSLIAPRLSSRIEGYSWNSDKL